MKIAVDISQIVYEGSGVARYTNNLVKALTTYDKKNEYVFFLSTLRGKLSEASKDLLKDAIVNKFLLPPIALDVLWNRLHIVPMEHFVGDVDLVITSDWTEPPTVSAKKIAIIHDLVVYKYPETSTNQMKFNLRNFLLSANIVDTQKRRLKWATRESNRIIVDSKSTKNDLKDYLHADLTKVDVVYPGIELTTTPADLSKTVSKYDLKTPFILTVGKFEPRKNMPRLIKAFDQLNRDDVDLVIVGPQGWGNQAIATSSHVRLLGFVPDRELCALYQACIAFVAPSMYEGFGYPLVEAMTLGAACACSATSSLGEIGKGFCLTFNPGNVNEISKTLSHLIDDKNLREQLKQQSKNRARFFQLPRFANQLLHVINSV